MGTRRWFDNTFADTWGPVLMLALLAVIGPGVIDSALDERSPWQIFLVLAWALLVVVQVTELIRRRTHHPSTQRVDTATIPVDDVADAISEAPSRVKAVKLLRERHPGLGLKEAADLVDARR
ncbi:hypothetical protein CH263_24400 [Rhodococcus sp. 06-1059B-a]|nr:hypothetical protein [Rhodococcus sp. 06-1059B-a]OZD58406.1 hypothetical protein CH263_24400 [Rhodococcus sp. 06-1059B-a]